MVNIHLINGNSLEHFLSVPPNDIERLSIQPLKWLRFVMFAICGARGDLTATLGGPPVNYDSTSFADIAEDYYYYPCSSFVCVDYQALNDRITSSAQTLRRHNFRTDIIERDGESCVFTAQQAAICDAAHIIPRSKGDEYISAVIRDRLSQYDSTQAPGISSINAVENGILLRKDLHAMFAAGSVAFLKTPNFALDPADIPRVEAGPMPPDRITLQHLKPPTGFAPIPARDAQFTGTGRSLPPAVLLDFTYGVAAYARWGVKKDGIMQKYYSEHYKDIPIPPQSEPSTPDHSSEESDDSRDSDYKPRTPPRQRNHESSLWDGMVNAMDRMNTHLMQLSGITPEARAAQWQKQVEEEELKAQESSRAKVLDWMQRYPCNDQTHETIVGSEVIEQ